MNVLEFVLRVFKVANLVEIGLIYFFAFDKIVAEISIINSACYLHCGNHLITYEF